MRMTVAILGEVLGTDRTVGGSSRVGLMAPRRVGEGIGGGRAMFRLPGAVANRDSDSGQATVPRTGPSGDSAAAAAEEDGGGRPNSILTQLAEAIGERGNSRREALAQRVLGRLHGREGGNDVTGLAWSRSGARLVVGTSKACVSYEVDGRHRRQFGCCKMR